MPLTATAQLEIVSGNNQTGQVETWVTSFFIVKLTVSNNPIEGRKVYFEISEKPPFATGPNSGHLSVTSIRTSANGEARTKLALGNLPGTYKVKAIPTNIHGHKLPDWAVEFTVTAWKLKFTEGDSTSRSVAENEPIGTRVGTLLDTSVEGEGFSLIRRFTLARYDNSDHSSFSIDEQKGQLKTKKIFDYETKKTYTVWVIVEAGENNDIDFADMIKVTINVLDVVENVEETPSFVAGDSTSRSVAENEPIGTNVGAPLSVNSVEGVHHYFVYATSNDPDRSWFSVGVNSGQLKTKQVFDYETKNSYAIAVDLYSRVDGADFLVDSIIVTINVTEIDRDIKRGPAFTEGKNTTRSVAENTPSGVNIGAPVSATDPDGDTLTYSWGSTNASKFFYLDTSTGQLRTKAPLDYEGKKQYNIVVSVTDGKYGNDSITVIINVTDVFEPPLNEPLPSNNLPSFTEGDNTTRAIAENTPPGINIGAPVSATDPDGDILTYRWGSTNASKFFYLDSSTGQLRTKAPLDYEYKKRYSILVAAIDGRYGNDYITVIINVTDVFEPPLNKPPSPNRRPSFTEGDSTTRAIAENTPPGVNIGDPVSATDPDGDTLTYIWASTDASTFFLLIAAPVN